MVSISPSDWLIHCIYVVAALCTGKKKRSLLEDPITGNTENLDINAIKPSRIHK
jgi:hypothetical protein